MTLLEKLRQPLTMSMFRHAADLAAEALAQRKVAADLAGLLLVGLKAAVAVEERDLAGDPVEMLEREQWLHLAREAIAVAEAAPQ